MRRWLPPRAAPEMRRRAAARTENFGIERKRRLAPGVLRKFVEARVGVGEYFALAGLALERRAQRQPAAIPGDGEQSSSLKPNSGLRSTVASARSSSGSSSASASAIRSITAICSVSTSRSAPATSTCLILQRADDRLEQLAALAHQDQNVAVARGAALDADRLAAVDQPPHRARDALRQFHPRTGLAHGVERRIPAFDLRRARPVATGSQISTTPGGASGNAICGGKPSRSDVTLAAMPANTRSTAARMLSPERNECSSRPGTKSSPHRQRARARSSGASRQIPWARRSGTNRSTASRRRRRKWCGSRRARRRRR